MTQPEKIKIPALYELKAIEPSAETVSSETLGYNNLDSAVEQQRGFEGARYAEFYDADTDSITEEAKARGLARLYMVMSAQRLVNAYTDEQKSLWSDRFTQATSELYGQPDIEVARTVGSERACALIADAEAAQIDTVLIDRYKEMITGFGLNESESTVERQDFSETATVVGEYMKDHYSDVFDALQLEEGQVAIDMAQFTEAVERGFDALAKNHDEDWKDWSVEKSADTSTLTTYAKGQKLRVGMQHTPLSAKKAKGLFAHEILVHGLRGMNGKKLSDQAQKGFVGYLEAEEGLGIFTEYSVTGNLPKSAGKYVDIALALGLIDGQKHTRQEMIEFVSTRMLIENELKTDDKQSDESVMNIALKHVNRIYRGTLGNEHVGVFTKDIAYYDGFIKMGGYITESLERGVPIEEVMDYTMQAKFDPTNPRHAAEIERLNHEK